MTARERAEEARRALVSGRRITGVSNKLFDEVVSKAIEAAIMEERLKCQATVKVIVDTAESDEREECAKIAERYLKDIPNNHCPSEEEIGPEIAEAIRKRGQG